MCPVTTKKRLQDVVSAVTLFDDGGVIVSADGWAWKRPVGMGGGAFGRRGDVVVVTGDGGRYWLFSVIADCAAPRSTMLLSAA